MARLRWRQSRDPWITGGAKETSDRFGSADSASLVSVLAGEARGWKDEIIAEYYGPGVAEPWLCIRRGNLKYVHTRNHRDLLFDLSADPNEQTDLADDPQRAECKQQLRAVLLGRYDVEAMTRRAVQSKKTRRFLHDTMAGSEGYRWDYQPEFDSTKQYVRGVNSPSTV